MAGCITTEINIDNYWKIYTSIQIQRERIMGKYIHLFQTKEELNQAIDNNFTGPWVSYTEENDKVDYYKSKYEQKCEQYFTIEATEDETLVYFRQSQFAVDEGISPLKVEVSTDDGKTWVAVTAAPTEDDIPGAILAGLDQGEKVLIRGRNEAYGYYSINEAEAIENCNFLADGPCYVYGNIMSLVGGNDFARIRKVEEYAFAYFFSDYDGELDWSWVLSKEGEELLLPATTMKNSCYHDMFSRCTGLTFSPALPAIMLAPDCYSSMFRGCAGLIVAPELPASTAEGHCYYSMFQGCKNLTVAPELPATVLGEYCYSNMFTNCTGLISAPDKLPATTLANFCYQSMFSGCTNLINAPELLATILAIGCYGDMFSGCISLVNAPALPAPTLRDYCYSRMFAGCTSLASAPELPAITLVLACYNNMFLNCANLSYIKAMFTTTPGNSYTNNWVDGVKDTGTFVKFSAATWNVTGANGVPTGWTVETTSVQ